jgi:maleate isomerase
MAPKRICIGILVPSSNTALEPLTTQILSSIPNVSVCFSRFRVTTIALQPTPTYCCILYSILLESPSFYNTIGLSQDALAQFDVPKIIDAAQLLADAEVDVIGWSGTSAGWLGFEVDEKLCAAIQERRELKRRRVRSG